MRRSKRSIPAQSPLGSGPGLEEHVTAVGQVARVRVVLVAEFRVHELGPYATLIGFPDDDVGMERETVVVVRSKSSVAAMPQSANGVKIQRQCIAIAPELAAYLP